MKIFNCNTEWPVCLYDFTAKNKNPTQLCFRVGNDLNDYKYNDYFYSPLGGKQPLSGKFQPGLFPTQQRSEMLIERQPHLCCNKEFPSFVHNFKMRYQAHDHLLIKNVCVSLFLPEDTQNHEFHRDFMTRVS